MRDQRDRMIEKQAELISRLNQTLADERKAHQTAMIKAEQKLNDYRAYAEFYKELQETILKSPMLMIEWQRFCLGLKMIDPDEHKYQAALEGDD